MRRGKVCLGVVCIIGAIMYIIIAVMEETLRAPMAVLAAIFLLFAFLLFRKKKEKPAPQMDFTLEPQVSTSFTPEVPDEVLKQMKKSYTKQQAMRDAQIMRESFLLCQQTNDFHVFCMRYTLSHRMAYTLLQAEQAKCRGVAALKTRKAAEGVLEARDALKIDFLDRVVEKEIQDAQSLKTLRGQRNRLEKLLNTLRGNEATFAGVDEYDAAIDRVGALLDEIEKAGEA